MTLRQLTLAVIVGPCWPLAGTGAKGRSCEIARPLRYEPEAGHSCRYCGRAAGRFGAVASAGASALSVGSRITHCSREHHATLA
jgi:hypothetical protein